MQPNKTVLFASVVLLLALFTLKGQFGTMPSFAASHSFTATAVSVRFAAHMAELRLRHALAVIGRIITIR